MSNYFKKKNYLIEKYLQFFFDFDSNFNSNDVIWLLGKRYNVDDDSDDHDLNDNERCCNDNDDDNNSSYFKSHQSNDNKFNWPTDFLQDFSSKISCCYRTSFTPIKVDDDLLLDLNLPLDNSFSFSKSKPWPLRHRLYTSDQGWGCMLRSSQSLLANTIVILNLGRDFIRPTKLSNKQEFKSYISFIKILSLFFDNPSNQCPFSVHRMAIVGKSFGKDVSQLYWQI